MEEPQPTSAPTLAAPGAGLPKPEEFMLRHLALPMMGALIPWTFAAKRFQHEGQRILRLAEGLDPLRLTTPALVPRLLAMEDSSRYWSASMTIRHLMLVGEPLADIVVTLSQGRASPISIGIADVKPEPDTPASVVGEFRTFLAHFDQRMRFDVIDRGSRQAHVHPWMGPLTAQQWLCLAAVHQRLHRRQIQMILQRLERAPI